MKHQAQNTFSNGVIMDLNPLSTPRDVLTDCLNGTIITYNGDEFVLQNDMGNCQVDSAYLSPGFIPVGMKEYAGIVYVASLNPETGVCELGSFPSPQEDFSTTDFGDIGPANFVTANFVVDTGDDSVQQNTEKDLKLFEPEILQLAPGDLYVVMYNIIDPNPSDPGDPNKIDNETKYEAFISQDPANRKLFKLKFSKITGTNNLVALPPTEIHVIPFKQDLIDSDYAYYKEPSQATLTVGLELETMDYFNAQVIDTSLNTNADKQVTVAAVGNSNSLAVFDGVRVNVTSPVTETLYLENVTANTKVTAVLDGLTAGANFQCSITPYSPYALYPTLTQTFNVTLGQYLSVGSGVNNLFSYFVDQVNNYVRVDFDYRFQGNSAGGIAIYVEFYDPWSDYSVVKTVDNPTYYGLNTVILNLVDEPRIDEFDSTTVGGTSPNSLITNTDVEYQKTLLNSTNLIRIDQSLRKNHFYIVRVSGVDKSYDATTQLFTYQHYDFYKGLYTTTMYNALYTKQSSMSVTDPGYVEDYNSLDFDLTQIAYQTAVTPVFSTTQATVTQNYPQVPSTDPVTGAPIVTYPLMTNNDWYAIYPQSAPWTGSMVYESSDVYETDAEYNVALTLEGTQFVFGDFDTSLLSVDFPDLVPSTDTSGSGVKPTIVEQVIPGTPSTGTVASWQYTALSDLLYKVDLSLVTNRSITAAVQATNKNGTQYSEVSLLPSFRYFENNGPLTNPYASIELSQSPDYYKWVGPSGDVQTASGSADDGDLFNAYESYPRKWSAFWGSMYNRCGFWYWPGAPGDLGDVHNTNCSDRNNVLMLRDQSNNFISACRVFDINVAKDIFTTLKVASNVQIPLILYNPDPSQVSKNGEVVTTAQFTGANIITNFSPETSGGSFVKTYLSTFAFHALGTTEEFNPTVINDYIATRISDSTILDGKQTIRDGFIPFIQTVQQSTYQMVFNDILIDQSANAANLSNILAGGAQGQNDQAFVSLGNYKPHGTLFSSDSSKYTDLATTFKVGGFTAGVTIDPNTVYVFLNQGYSVWPGYYRIGGSPKYRNAPDMYQPFQYS